MHPHFLMEVYVPLLKLEGIPRGIQHHMLLSKTMYYAFQQPSVLIQGHALDKKTPLLRSMEAINKEALRILHLFHHDDVTMVKMHSRT